MAIQELLPIEEQAGMQAKLDNVRRINPSFSERSWSLPETQQERIDLAWREFPFRPGELIKMTPTERQRAYKREGLAEVREKYQADGAFLIHPRGVWVESKNGILYVAGDIERHFGGWSVDNFGITPHNIDTALGETRMHELFNMFMGNTPSGFVVGRYEGVQANVLVIASSMVPEIMLGDSNLPSALHPLNRVDKLRRMRAGQTRLIEAAIFAHEVCGAKVLGLGAMNSLGTQFGKAILKHYEGVPEDLLPQIVTGHRTTTAKMVDIGMDALAKIGLSDELAKIGIIGAGSIGSSAAIEMVRRGFNGEFVIYDHNLNKSKMLADKLKEKGIRVKIIEKKISDSDWAKPFDGRKDEFYPLRCADLVLAAPSTIKPVIEGRFFLPGVIYVNDSQPQSTTVDMMETPRDKHPGGLLLDVMATSNGATCTFDAGAPLGADYTCAVETIAATRELLLTGKNQAYARSVEPTSIPPIIEVVERWGYGETIFGRGNTVLDDSVWEQLKAKRNGRPSFY